eukprot:gene26299-37110_t
MAPWQPLPAEPVIYEQDPKCPRRLEGKQQNVDELVGEMRDLGLTV